LLEVFKVFEQEALLEENEILSNFLDLSVIKKLVDHSEPGFFEKEMGLFIKGLDGYLIIADLELEV
jgi:hypothetical protein